MKNISNKTILIAIGLIIVLACVYSLARHESHRTYMTTSPVDMTMSTSTVTTATTTTSDAQWMTNPNQIFSYYLNIATTTFSQNDVIPMTLFVYNLKDVPETMNFSNGCAATYRIADFDMMKHIVCQPDPTSITIAPHDIRQITLSHYPSVYQIPVGTYDLYTGAVGYGGIFTKITITN